MIRALHTLRDIGFMFLGFQHDDVAEKNWGSTVQRSLEKSLAQVDVSVLGDLRKTQLGSLFLHQVTRNDIDYNEISWDSGWYNIYIIHT